MISKTKITRRTRRKTNSELVETILNLKKSNLEAAKLLSLPTRKQIALNLEQINKQAKQGETIIIAGKVLGEGDIEKNKKLKIIALNFSCSALEKLKKANCEVSTIKEELEKSKNKKLSGRVLK